jgi:hypothetical protein
VTCTFWKLKLGDVWTVPVVELQSGEPKGTTLLLADAGRKTMTVQVERLLKEGQRVLAVDPFYFGECKIADKDWLFALLVSSVGDRPLGLQASQIGALARWAQMEGKTGPLTLQAVGPRCSIIALAAAGLDEKAIQSVVLNESLGSLKEVLEKNTTVPQMPELFCFGLLEAFDVKHLAALAAPRPVLFANAGDRVKKELAGLKGWYKTLGTDFDPVP